MSHEADASRHALIQYMHLLSVEYIFLMFLVVSGEIERESFFYRINIFSTTNSDKFTNPLFASAFICLQGP